MSNPPLVTVLMTVYNGLPYLLEAIDSILNQTLENFEFLIIDDGGTDDSAACISAYQDPRIRLERNEHNIGQVASLNRGLTLAKGPYIARMDQDDISLPDRLRQQLDFLEQHPAVAVVGTWGHKINSRGFKVGLWRKQIDNYGHFIGYLLWGHNPLWHPAVMFRRDIVLQVGGYDPSVAPVEDYKLWTQLAIQRHTAKNVPDNLFLYRVHATQQSSPTATLPSRKRAHNQMLGQFCLPEQTPHIGRLFRIDADFWTECRSHAQLVTVLQATELMLQKIGSELKLSPAENKSMRQTLYQRLGYGIYIGPKISNWPRITFYPIFFLLSPMLIPRLWQTLLPLAMKIRQTIHKIKIFGQPKDR